MSSEVIQYEEEKKKCKELVEELYNKVNGAIDIHSLTYAVYPKIVNWETKRPLFKTVESWVTGIWVKNDWKKKEEECVPIVYGIIDGDRLVYIGKTVRGLALRQYEHETGSSNVSKYLHEHEGCKFIVLANGISDYEISLMEKRMIEVCKPLLNKEGNSSDYKFELSKEGNRDKIKQYADMVEEVDDLNLFIDSWVLSRNIELWRCEEEINEKVQQEFNFEIGIDDENLIK